MKIKITTPLEWAEALFAAGCEEREVARAYFYADRYGMDACRSTKRPGCMEFQEPSCGDWNCVSPEHQNFVEVD